MKYPLISFAVIAGLIVSSAYPAFPALTAEGQSGGFLNTHAFTIPPGQVQTAYHGASLDAAGDVFTYSAAAGLKENLEVGYTHVSSSVTGVRDQNNLLLKWRFAGEERTDTSAALWAVHRDVQGIGSTMDYGLSASQLVYVGSIPVVLNIGARSTKALGLGLFGIGDDREVKLEGGVAVYLSEKLSIGAEFKQQIDAKTWNDVAVRYYPTDRLTVDAGIGYLNPQLDNQFAFGVTYTLPIVR